MRWLKFNAVGAMGMMVHLGLLGLFVHVLGMHYLVATGVSVEIAILHNFVWHRRWTWADRRAEADNWPSALLRFNLTNGLVSLVSNLFSASVLTGLWHLDPIVSNFLSLIPSCVTNYLLTDRVVFRRPQLNPTMSALRDSEDGQCFASGSIE